MAADPCLQDQKSTQLVDMGTCVFAISENVPCLKPTHLLRMNGWKMNFLLGLPICRCYVSFRRCIFPSLDLGGMPLLVQVLHQGVQIDDAQQEGAKTEHGEKTY